jgi:hypothetical protein
MTKTGGIKMVRKRCKTGMSLSVLDRVKEGEFVLNTGLWFAVQDPNIYSLGGFQRLCK